MMETIYGLNYGPSFRSLHLLSSHLVNMKFQGILLIETECTVMLFLLLTSEQVRIMEKVIVPQP